jgi:phosphotransferase system HPr-like phosphotransfer protein
MEMFCDISFAERVRLFSYDYLKCCLYISETDTPRSIFTKKLCSELVGTSQVLEDFLDFHGAKNNTQWYFYRELTAAVRHLSLSGYCQKHILNRLIFYDLPDTERFEREGERTLDFLTKTLMNLAPIIIAEARRLFIPVPTEKFDAEDFPDIVTGEMLANDIDDPGDVRQQKHLVRIANEFLDIAEKFDQHTFYELYTPEQILTIVPDQINEVEIRRFEMLVHNLQSAFDTYVIHGGFKGGNQKLKSFRSFFSVAFHLFQMMGRLLHFYERHLYESGYKDIYKKVQDRLMGVIDPEMLLDRTINYGLYYVCYFLSAGKELAQQILNENMERSAVTVPVPKLGFHCRPSLMVAKIVQHYGGQVELCVGDDRFDGTSVLDIQYAGGKIQKEGFTEVIFEGDARALKDIRILAAVNYGEDTMGKGVSLPKELSYLRT